MTKAAPLAAARRPLFAALGARLSDAWPGWRVAVGGSLAWALAMGIVAIVELAWSGWYEPSRIAFIALFFAAGGLVAFLPAVCFGRLLSRGRADAGFAATFLALAIATVGLTGFLIGLQYREYYAAWHEPPFTVIWVFQFIFTVGSAVYQFLVLGLRIYVPLGLLLLLAVSFWNVRAMR